MRPRHPLIGGRDDESGLEWRTTLDPDLEPALADHRVDGQILLPGTAFLEMALAVARGWAGDEAAISGFEILQPLIFTTDGSREILCRVASSTASIEIMSRPRLSKVPYATHARGKILQKPGPITFSAEPADLSGGVEGGEIYLRAASVGLEFGPSFRRLARAKIVSESLIEVELTEDEQDSRFGLDPASLEFLLSWAYSAVQAPRKRAWRLSAHSFRRGAAYPARQPPCAGLHSREAPGRPGHPGRF